MYVRHSQQFEDAVKSMLSQGGENEASAIEILEIIELLKNSEVCTGDFSPEKLGSKKHMMIKLIEFNQKMLVKSADGQRVLILYEIKPIQEFWVNQSDTWRIACMFDVIANSDGEKLVTLYPLTIFDKETYKDDPDAPYKLGSLHGEQLVEAIGNVGCSNYIPSTTRNSPRRGPSRGAG